MTELRPIRTVEDADSIRPQVAEVFDGWFSDVLDEPAARIDWEEFLDRLERYDLDLGDKLDTPAIRRIKKIVRELRSDGSRTDPRHTP